MIKHILNRVWNERRTNFWIGLELLLISVCLWFAVDFLYVKLYSYNQPLGFDIEHTYRVELGMYEQSSFLYKKDHQFTDEELYKLLDRIKRDSTVEAVCLTRSLFHYRRHISSAAIALIPNDTLNRNSVDFYPVTADYFKVFRVKSRSDNSYQSLSDAISSGGVVISPATEPFLTQGESAVGKMIYKDNGTIGTPVKGVCTADRMTEFFLPNASVYELITQEEMKTAARSLGRTCISIRVKPLADSEMYARDFTLRMQEHLSFGNVYLDELVPTQHYRKISIKTQMDELQTAIAIAFFFVVNIFLGILGTFWFRTRQRKSELGLRVALGSNRMQLRTLLIGEGLILLTMAFIPAIVFSFNICYAELIDVYLMPFSGLRFTIGLGITYLLLAATIVLGIWIPAQQAIKISPTEALHNT